MKSYIKDWTTARAVMQTARNKKRGKPLGRGTTLEVSVKSREQHGSDQAIYALVYWYTEVVRYYPDGTIGINMEGHDTKTTKQRIKEFSPGAIFSVRGGGAILNAFNHRAFIPIDIGSEYKLDPQTKTVFGPQGEEYDKEVVLVGTPRPVPKSRNAASNPRKGDVLVNKDGQHFIVKLEARYRSTELEVKRYYGDDPNDRRYCHVEYGDGTKISPMFLLSTEHEWKAAERFVRELPKKVAS